MPASVALQAMRTPTVVLVPIPVRIDSTGGDATGGTVSGPTVTRTVAWPVSEPASWTVYLNVSVPVKPTGGW